MSLTIQLTDEQVERLAADILKLNKPDAPELPTEPASPEPTPEEVEEMVAALNAAEDEHRARLAIFCYDGPEPSAERERLGKRLEEARHNSTLLRESALAPFQKH